MAHNMVLNRYYAEPFAHTGVINEAAIHQYAAQLVEQFDVRTPSVETLAGSLSGGNQQKMVVAF
ncbi:MAG: hypothetical protein R2911_17855 [Caldilineaceae bacterium]